MRSEGTIHLGEGGGEAPWVLSTLILTYPCGYCVWDLTCEVFLTDTFLFYES